MNWVGRKIVEGFSAVAMLVGLLVGQALAASHGGPKRALIIIPGIVGSELSNADGDVIWGRVSSLRSKNFTKLNLLPKQGEPVALRPTDALRSVPLIFGRINVGVYSDLIDFLKGESSIFDSAANKQILGNYTEGQDLFVFAYDWRRSNFANAVLLNEFVEKNIPAAQKFDIVAHSMGGLLTRAFLSNLRPQDHCTSNSLDSTLGADEAKALCHAVYGVLGSGGWRGIDANGRFSQAARLHTFVTIATPHRGSVNVASTMIEGWGRLSQVLLGGRRAIQDIILSMVGMYELTPSYENCCAVGKVGSANNVKVARLDEVFWAERVLGFGVDPCPYVRCATKRELLQIGLANRKLLDDVVAAGLPDTVKSKHIMIGRLVKGTREVIYVDHNAAGDGDGMSYRFSERGDGTVYEGSAVGTGNQSFILRGKHPFIVGTEEVRRYIFNVLIDPVNRVPQVVSSKRFIIADGDVRSLSLTASSQIVAKGEEVLLVLDLVTQNAEPFDTNQLGNAEVTMSARANDSTTAVWQQSVTANLDQSVPDGGELSFTASLTVTHSGVYVLSATYDGTVVAREFLYVLEE